MIFIHLVHLSLTYAILLLKYILNEDDKQEQYGHFPPILFSQQPIKESSTVITCHYFTSIRLLRNDSKQT